MKQLVKMVDVIGEAENALSHQLDSMFALQDEEHAMLNLLKVVGRLVLANVPHHESAELMELLKTLDKGCDFESSRIQGTAYFTGS